MKTLSRISLAFILLAGLTITSGATLAGCGSEKCSFTIRGDGLPNGRWGQQYSLDMHSDEDCRWSSKATDIKWSVMSGTLPPGISFNNEGHFRGTPNLVGTYTFTIEAVWTYDEDSTKTAQKGFAITIESLFKQ